MAYVFDDHSVTNGAGSNAIIAGIIVDYSGGYVWVDTFNVPRTAGSFTTLAASGAATFSAALSCPLISNTASKVVCATNICSGRVQGTSFGVGATQSGYTYVVTNKMVNYTNFLWIGAGIITNVTMEGALP
jgi:hypothetical protein